MKNVRSCLVLVLLQEKAALSLRDAIINEVARGNMTVVCDGVTRSILPGEKSGFYAPTIFLEKEKIIDVFYQFFRIINSSLRFK